MKHSPKKSSQTVSNFIEKTYRILENEGFNSIVGWTSSGASFIIKDIKQFQESVLPMHFKHSNFSSFVRQLNMYNFHKVRGDRQDCQFQHEQFKKDRRDLLSKIKRKQSEALIMSHNNIESGGLNYHSLSEQSNQLRKMPEIGQSQGQSQQNPEADSNKLQEMRKLNKSLKQLKSEKIQEHKKLSSVNNSQIGEKFFKLITCLLAQKIKKDLGHHVLIPEKFYDEDTQHNSFDYLIDHVVGDSQPMQFRNYTQTANSLSQKQNSYDFMIKKQIK